MLWVYSFILCLIKQSSVNLSSFSIGNYTYRNITTPDKIRVLDIARMIIKTE